MSSSRKIASNLLWTEHGIVHSPLISLSADGIVTAIDTCDMPDKEPLTEFYAGLIVLNFPNDHRAAFAWLLAQNVPLSNLLPQLERGNAIVVISGLDYEQLRPLPTSQIIAITPNNKLLK